MLATCRELLADHSEDAKVLLDVGSLLYNFGFLSEAQNCFTQTTKLLPNDLLPLVNLANLARDAGHHNESHRLYALLQERLPHHPVIRRNTLVSHEYNPNMSDDDRLKAAHNWGRWAVTHAGGPHPRPLLTPLGNRALRVGYVSADFCQHTVGLFVKDVLKHHNPNNVVAYSYSAGQISDWVTSEIRGCSTFHDVSGLDDAALAEHIRNDNIDILVDLSGHTAGSRLTVFAHRPAPVQVSWLGYFAATGLPYIDAVLLDEWHAPPGMEEHFVEPIIRLPNGRLCYQAVPFAPDVAPSPCLKNGYVTFGCFNNTAKLNPGVFDRWSKILTAVPTSRLVLKWRTFNDEALRQSVKNSFANHGVNAERIELRGPSFHVDVLREYSDIDIALDPFPFTGGLTSCESLWMGVPVVTWPQSRVVSRQTYAFLSAIGLPELAATDGVEYVRIAVDLANNPERLSSLRQSLRDRMRSSPLMDVRGFTCQLENTFISLYRSIEAQNKVMNPKTIIHVGPGHRRNGAKLPPLFQTPAWKEIRVDIDPATEPDIIGSMLDMQEVAADSVDAIYSAHNIEHVYAYEVPVVLKEFLRVLTPEGFLIITCPDLQTVCALAAEDKLTDTAYQSPAGPITPLDILYGHGEALALGRHFMAHKCGFTLKSLTAALQTCGFQTIAGKRRIKGFDLWILATKSAMSETEIRALAAQTLPE
jgi:SAM-dependent methyltransferase